MEAWKNAHIREAYWIVVICLLPMTIYPISCNIQDDFHCPESYNCSCSANAGSYRIQCEIEGAVLPEVEFDSGNNVNMRCLNEDDKFENLSTLSFIKSNGSFDSFRFHKCPLPKGPLINIPRQMGLENVKNILFTTYRRKNTMNFKRLHFKGMNDVTRLDLSNNDINNISEDVFDDITKLKDLNLENNKISLNPGLFKSLSNLESLNLNQNGLSHIPTGIFKYSKSLNELNLRENIIENITTDSFQGLVHLKYLNLAINNLNILPDDLFYNLNNLIKLNLSENNIHSFPEQLFINNNKLEVLDLSYNEQTLMKIPSKFIHSLESLIFLQLKKCKISQLAESFFWNLTEIRSISLERNLLTKIQENLFKDQTNLVFLNLNDNEIKQISNLAFRSLTKLEILKMDNNKVNRISGKIFEHLVSLKELSMKHNGMREIDPLAFVTTRNIERIDFSYNMLTMLEGNELLELAHLREIIEARSPFHCLGRLKYLNLSHNWITEIYSDWKYELLDLKSLDLTYNNMSCIMFGNLNFLANGIEVDLQHNNISTIDFKTANHYYQPETNIEPSSSTASVTVLIDNNPLNCDCLLYGFIRYLEGKLNPQVKNIVRVEAGSTKCATPRELEGKLLIELKEEDMLCPLDDPDGSYTKMCPANCTCFVRVSDKSIIVNCSNSDTKLLAVTLPNVESNHLNCTEVHFEGNHLKDLSIFSNKRSTFDQITRLFVAGNNISYLNVEDIPSRIEHFDLSNNLLTFVNPAVVDALNNAASLKYFWISGNPLKCDAENLPLFLFLKNNYQKVLDYDNIICADGKTMSTYMKEQLEIKLIKR